MQVTTELNLPILFIMQFFKPGTLESWHMPGFLTFLLYEKLVCVCISTPRLFIKSGCTHVRKYITKQSTLFMAKGGCNIFVLKC